MKEIPTYNIEYIKAAVAPIARKYRVKSMSLFGSYARGEADTSSDIDFHLIDTDGLWGYFKLCSFKQELEDCLGTQVDVITTGAMDSEILENVRKDEVMVYVQ